MTSAVCVWDFTISKDKVIKEDFIKLLEKTSKKWCFQLEEGKSGYEHYQGRLSLKIKTRLNGVRAICEKAHWSKTSSANRDNMFYVMKDDTRLDGPWMNTDERIYIPRQIREIETLYKWQQKIIDISKIWDTRHINIVLDTKGNIGKSTLVSYMRVHKLARTLPPMKNYKDIIRATISMPVAKVYMIDMPRAIGKDNLGDFFSGIETLKSGYCWDDRYSYKERNFDCPNVWVFTNQMPDRRMLTPDRWVLWEINAARELTRYRDLEREDLALRCNTENPHILNIKQLEQLEQTPLGADLVDSHVTPASLSPRAGHTNIGPANFAKKKRIKHKLGLTDSTRFSKDDNIGDFDLNTNKTSIDFANTTSNNMIMDNISGRTRIVTLNGIFRE